MTRARVLTSASIAVAIAGILLASPASAASPPDAMYGSGLKAGDRVEVFDGPKACGATTANANGQWLIWIATTAPCGPADGDKLGFHLNGAATTAAETFKIGGAPARVATGVRLSGTGARSPRPASRHAPSQPIAGGGSTESPPDTMYGSGLSDGDRVQVLDGAKSCGSTTADRNGQWIIWIAAAAPCKPAQGDHLTFMLNGTPMGAEEVFKVGGAPAKVATGVDLNGAMAPPPR
jgi:hypothetical protein